MLCFDILNIYGVGMVKVVVVSRRGTFGFSQALQSALKSVVSCI